MSKFAAIVVLCVLCVGIMTSVVNVVHGHKVHDVQFGRVPAVIEHNEGHIHHVAGKVHHVSI